MVKGRGLCSCSAHEGECFCEWETKWVDGVSLAVFSVLEHLSFGFRNIKGSILCSIQYLGIFFKQTYVPLKKRKKHLLLLVLAPLF